VIFASATKLDREQSLAACYGSDDQEWLFSGCYGAGQRGIRRVVRQVFVAGKEAQEGSALLRDLIADGPSEHRVASFQRVE
jgi:hypothetical protein